MHRHPFLSLASLFLAVVLLPVLTGCGGGGGGGDGDIAITENPAGPTGTSGDPVTTLAQALTATDYLEASSIPHEIISLGIVAGLLARNAPSTSSLRAAIQLRKAPVRMIRASSKVTRDADGWFRIEATNLPGDADYSAIEGDGRNSIRLRYLDGAGQTQDGPVAGTRKVELEAMGENDYGLIKYSDYTIRYHMTLPAGQTDWLASPNLEMKASESGTYKIIERSFTYSRNGTLTIRASDGELVSGEVTDTLTSSGGTYTAKHTVAGGTLSSTYEADGTTKAESNPSRLLADKTLAFQWSGTQSLSKTSGFLTLPVSGLKVSYLKAMNDRINCVYPTGPVGGSYADSVYARVFQYACSTDPDLKELVDFILSQTQGGNIANPVSFAIDLVTVGITYVADQQTYFEKEYVALPGVGLYFGQGDCEDRTILLGAMLHRLGGDVIFVLLNGDNGESGHACLGLAVPASVEAAMPAGSVYWTYQGKKYFYLEATGPNDLGASSDVVTKAILAALIPPVSSQPTVNAGVRDVLGRLP